MNTLMAYERDAYLTALETRVIGVGEVEGRPYVLLADTPFYPEGGGQPSDQGWLGEARVLGVQKGADGLRHVLDRPLAAGPVVARLDWRRRFDHMQQHSAQHLLTALAQDRFGWMTTAFHLGESVSDIEVDAPALDQDQLLALEGAAAEEIRRGRAVSARRVNAEAYARETVRSRGLPDGHQGDIRLVEIAGLDLNTCGGTHVRSIAELEALCLLGTEPIRGGTRIFYVAGARVRERMRAHELRNLRLRTLLGAPDADLATVAEGKLEQLAGSERRGRHLEEALAASLAESLASRPDLRVVHHLEGMDGAFLGRVGRSLAALAPAKVALLTATKEGLACFVLAAGAEAGVDLPSLGQEVATLLDGRGGGKAPVFQGKAGSLERLAVAVARVKA